MHISEGTVFLGEGGVVVVGDGESAAAAACAEEVDAAAAASIDEDEARTTAAEDEAAAAADAEEEAAAAASINEDEAPATAAKDEAAAEADAEEEAAAAAESREAVATTRLVTSPPTRLTAFDPTALGPLIVGLGQMMVLKVEIKVYTVIELDAELGCAHVSFLSLLLSPSLLCTASGQTVLALPSRPFHTIRHTPLGLTWAPGP